MIFVIIFLTCLILGVTGWLWFIYMNQLIKKEIVEDTPTGTYRYSAPKLSDLKEVDTSDFKSKFELKIKDQFLKPEPGDLNN